MELLPCCPELRSLSHSKGKRLVVRIGDEFLPLQQKPKVMYSQIEGQQLPVKHAALLFTVIKVPAEKSEGLPGTVHPLLTYRPLQCKSKRQW